MQFRSSLIFTLLAFVLSLAPSSRATVTSVPSAYDLNVVIDPNLGHLAVSGSIDFTPPAASGTLVFALHETFSIGKLLVNGKPAAFSLRPQEHTMIHPASEDVVVALPLDLPPGPIRIDITYQGKLKDLPELGGAKAPPFLDDQINARMVELATYSSWYPQFGVFGPPIGVRLQVSLPSGWIAICSGKELSPRNVHGRSITRWSSPNDTDVVITAAPNYKMRSARLPGGKFEIYSTRLPVAFVSAEISQIQTVMQLFSSRLGPTTIPAGVVKQVYSPKRYGQGRAGFARPGMIVTSEGRTLDALERDPSFTLLQDVSHEIGHFWWNSGAGQGDWINEAFAEYFSAIAVENVGSREQYDAVIARYRKQVGQLPPNAPSLSTVPGDGSWFAVRYQKGSLMLDDFRRVLGDEQFFSASRAFFERYRGTPTSSSDFRSFWRERLGDRASLVDQWLDSPGGLPASPAAAAAASR